MALFSLHSMVEIHEVVVFAAVAVAAAVAAVVITGQGHVGVLAVSS